jgi:prepilin-type processing-associated H-X9-DG protein
MKQIGLSLVMYANDYDDKTPQTSWETGPSIGPLIPWDLGKYQVHFTYLLQPYVKNYAIFIAPGDSTPDLPSTPCPNGSADFGKLNSSGQQFCDWQYPNSYLPAYNVLPAHDWLPVAYTTFPNPAGMIAIADRRYQSTFAGAPYIYSGKKGVSGFNPSQPCTQEGASFNAALSGEGLGETEQSSLASYGFWNAAVIAADESRIGAKTSSAPIRTDDPDVDRVWFDQYSQQSNYAFADGHAKTQPLGATLVDQPGSYEYGDTFYPSINLAQDGTCMLGG